MKRGIWIAIAVGIVLILVGVVVILMFVPLGPRLTALGSNPTAAQSTITPIKVTPYAAQKAAATAPAVSACGSGAMTFLALGESQPPRGTDAVRMARVDFDHRRIDVLTLPSDLWVSTPGLNSAGIGGTTLNNVYLQGKTLASGDERRRMLAAVDLFAGTLQANFGYTPEHYIVVKQAAFAEYVDSLGGVDVVLPLAVDGREDGMGYFPAGDQHLSGEMALDLARIDTDGKWENVDHQELVLQAIYQSMANPSNWDRLPALAEAFHEDVLTDLSVKQILDISCILKQAGVVFNQQQVGPEQVVISTQGMLPGPGLGAYIQQLVGK